MPHHSRSRYYWQQRHRVSVIIDPNNIIPLAITTTQLDLYGKPVAVGRTLLEIRITFSDSQIAFSNIKKMVQPTKTVRDVNKFIRAEGSVDLPYSIAVPSLQFSAS